MSLTGLAMLLAIGVFFWITLRAGRDRELFVLSVRDGKTELVRGRIPPALLEALRDVMASARVKRATVRAVRAQDHARLEASGLHDAILQRARNVLGTFPLARLLSAPARRAR
jgi:hypothetical protein